MRNKKLSRWAGIIIMILIIGAGIIVFQKGFTSDNRLAQYKQQGSEFLYNENYKRASDEYKKIIEIVPNDFVSYFQLAEAYIGLEDYEEAIDYLSLAVNIAVDEHFLIDAAQEITSLYIKIADCYSLLEDVNQRIRILKDGYERTKSERIKLLLDEYYPEEVYTSISEGEYFVETELEVALMGTGNIYYTLDNSEPTDESKLYQESIILPYGTYEIKAIVYNEYGYNSNVTEFTYDVKEINY